MKHWESLIASRMRPCVTICKIEDAGKRNQYNCQKRWREKNPEKALEIRKKSEAKRKNDPKRKAWQKAYDHSPKRLRYHKQYREENRETINARKRAYRATDEGKKKTSEYNRKYRLEHYERECARKREWWRRTHPNPKPIGRPKKEVA